MFWVLVHAHHATGPFGSDQYVVAQPQDVSEVGGMLVIKAQPQGRRKARNVIYPAGEWFKVTIIEQPNPGGTQ